MRTPEVSIVPVRTASENSERTELIFERIKEIIGDGKDLENLSQKKIADFTFADLWTLIFFIRAIRAKDYRGGEGGEAKKRRGGEEKRREGEGEGRGRSEKKRGGEGKREEKREKRKREGEKGVKGKKD